MNGLEGFMKILTTLLAVALIAAPAALRAQDPPAPAPTAAPAAQAAPVAPPAPAAVEPPKIIYEKVNVVVRGKAEYAGNVQLSVEPQGRGAKVVSVNVLAKEKDKDIAEQLHREITIALGGDYKVKLSGSEVRVSKSNKKAPGVSITITQVQLPGVSVLVERG